MTSCECIVFCLSPSLSLFRGAVHQHIGVQLPDPGERGGCGSHLRCRNSAPRGRAYICVPLKLRLRLKLHPTVDPSPTQKSVRGGGSLGGFMGTLQSIIIFFFLRSHEELTVHLGSTSASGGGSCWAIAEKDFGNAISPVT